MDLNTAQHVAWHWLKSTPDSDRVVILYDRTNGVFGVNTSFNWEDYVDNPYQTFVCMMHPELVTHAKSFMDVPSWLCDNPEVYGRA